MIIPSATASPCRKRRYFVIASSAWPAVCPKFSRRRRPRSRSSSSTTAAFMRQLVAMMGASTSGLRSKNRLCARAHPFEQLRVERHPVLHHLVEARAELAPRQRREHERIDRHELRLVECANQVLAERMVHPHLAADRAVHLRQQRRRDVRHRDPAQVCGRREPRGIADHAAADRNDAGAPVGASRHERVVHAAGGLQRLGTLTIGDEDALGARQRPRDGGAVQAPHSGAADDEDAPARSARRRAAVEGPRAAPVR